MPLACFLGVSLAPSLIDMGLGPLCLALSVFKPCELTYGLVQCIHSVHFEVLSWSNPWVVLCYKIEMWPPFQFGWSTFKFRAPELVFVISPSSRLEIMHRFFLDSLLFEEFYDKI